LEIQQLLQAARPELTRARDDIASLIPTYPNVNMPLLESIDGVSIHAPSESEVSIISTTEFAFDDVVLNTRLYRETLARLAAAKHISLPTDSRALATEEDLIDVADNMPIANIATKKIKVEKSKIAEVVETRPRVSGQEDPATLESMHSLALTYYKQGRWKDAEALCVQVVETRQRVLGQEDPATLDSMHSLALTYCMQGRWKEAEALGVQVVETRQRVLGKENPAMLSSMHNLASTYHSQGR
jgi:hypothetical protein